MATKASTVNTDERLLVTARDVAQMLSISERSVWRLVAAGYIQRPIRLRGATRFRKADVERVAAEGCPPIGN